MTYAPAQYTGNGVTTDRVFSFPYLSEDHVKVTLDGVDTAFTFQNATTVRITPAPANGVKILVYRVTPGTPIVTWADGATILGRHLNSATKQSLYLAEEADYTARESAMAKNAALTKWDADNLPIENIGTPTADDEAATKGYVDDLVEAFDDDLAAAVSDAEDAADDAADSATAAAASAVAAAASATSAAASVTAAATAYDNFDDRYLGQKAADPALDNDGNALVVGALYWNTVINKMKVWDSASWGLAFNDAADSDAIENVSGVSGATVSDALDQLDTDIGGKADSSHSHAQSDVTGLVAALAAKVPISAIVNDLTTGGTTVPLSAEQGKTLKTLVDGKAASSHTHAISDVTNLQRSLIRAFGSVQLNGTLDTGSLNVSSVTKTGTGTYEVVLSTAMPANYIPMAINNDVGGNPYILSITNSTTFTVGIFRTPNFAAYDSKFFFIVIALN